MPRGLLQCLFLSRSLSPFLFGPAALSVTPQFCILRSNHAAPVFFFSAKTFAFHGKTGEGDNTAIFSVSFGERLLLPVFIIFRSFSFFLTNRPNAGVLGFFLAAVIRFSCGSVSPAMKSLLVYASLLCLAVAAPQRGQNPNCQCRDVICPNNGRDVRRIARPLRENYRLLKWRI